MTKVLVTKDKLDTLAEIVGGKSETEVPLTLDEMIIAADSITSGGITPSGNIDIISAGVTDVTNYATATVPQGQMYADYIRGYKTVSGIKKWYVQPFAAIESGDEFGTEGYIADHTTEHGVEITYNAVPSGTTVTPSTSSQTIGGLNYMMEGAVTVNPIPSQYIIPSGTYTVDSSGTKDVTNYASISVPSAVPYTGFYNNHFYTENNQRKWSITSFTDVDVSEGDIEGWLPDGFRETSDYVVNAVPSNTTITPSTSAQTIGGANYMMEGAVTVSAMPTGTAGTPTATKGAVNNHAISVTPSVTNTTGYITGGTKTGTAVSVSASELVSGTLSVTQNGTADVTNYASVDVNVSGGGGGTDPSMSGTSTELSSASSTITFTDLQGEPTSFVVSCDDNLATGASPFKVAAVVYDGTSLHGQTITNTNNAQVTYDNSSFSYTYNNGTLTITSTGAYFQPTVYVIAYSYNGGIVDTKNVQVGSGATSISFTGLEDEPVYWSCIFKSNFSTSSGYQRVIWTAYTGFGGSGVYGQAMDSRANLSANWTASYNNGTLTITSTGTNAGGYFHQPGYYQLTYVIANASPYEKKSATYRASTSAQSDTIEPSSGYDAMSEVNISIPAVTQTNLTAGNIKSGTTVTISNGQSNLWSVTGTYSGGGGSSMNTQTVQSTSRRNSTSLGSITSLTCSKAGTYDIYWTCTRSNTSQTWGSQLYINNSAYGTENTTWSNNVQNNKLTGVTLSANQTVAVYGRSRNGYYIYAPQLTIVQTA